MYFTLRELLGHLWLNAFVGDLRNFHRVFFWTYRRYARPRDVLRIVTEEMEKLDGKQLSGTYGQLKWCSILGYWIDNHPRDFAATGTKKAFDALFELIEDRPHLALFKDRFLPFASQLDQLEPEELPWAIPDVDTGANLPPKLSPDSFSVAVSSGSTSSIPYDLSTSSLDYSSATSSPGPSPAVDLWESKALQRVLVRFNESGDMQIANDITRLVWRCFVRIEPRNVLTHVLSGSSEGRETPLGRSMQHFYDISAVFDDLSNLFVILIYSQTKTKTRAKMFERIIRIVHILRNQNNYIALMSGMTALSDVWMGRLTATKELAMEMLEKSGDGAVFKKFQSHFRLVENRQNYKNYRLAVKEDETAKRTAIPLMPVIIADVNRVAQSEDLRKSDSAVSWSKFDKFGQILIAMAELQTRGCPVSPSNNPNLVEIMLQDKPDIDEKYLYRRCDDLVAEEQNGNPLSSAFRKYFPKTQD